MKSVLQKSVLLLLLFPIAAMAQWAQLGQTINSPTPPGPANMANFGQIVALSEDGTVMAIGAPARGFSQDGASYVQVFRLESGEWIQIGSDIEGISTSTEYYENRVGVSIGLSADGTVLAVGEVNWNIEDGRVRVFRNINDEWIQIGEDIVELGVNDFGRMISLSSDGNVISINSIADELWAGMVKVFHNVSDNWVQMGDTIQGVEMMGALGQYMSINADGTRLALYETQGFFDATVVIYDYIDSEWEHTSTIIDGAAVPSLSADGTKLVVGDFMYSNQSGRAKLYSLSNDNDWIEEAVFEPQNPINSGRFGNVVSMSANADVIVIGTDWQGENVSVYQKTENEWSLTEEYSIEEGMTGTMSSALSANGSVLVIGKQVRDSNDDSNNFIYNRSAIAYKNCTISGDTIDEPQAVAIQGFTDGQTLSNLIVIADGTLTWYADETLTEVLDESTLLEDAKTYYVTQTFNGCISNAIAITTDANLDVSEVSHQIFKYYPNPVSDILNFATNNDIIQSVQIYDLLGKLVFEQQSEQNIDAVNLSRLAKGIYIAKIQTEKHTHTFKLAKE